MKVTRILHHSVNVESELEAAAKFYGDVLGLPLTLRPEIPGVAGRWFTVDAAQVHLVDAPSGPDGIQPTGPHVCFGVDDLDGALAELDEQDIEYICVGEGPSRQVWITDPCGNTIELQLDRR